MQEGDTNPADAWINSGASCESRPIRDLSFRRVFLTLGACVPKVVGCGRSRVPSSLSDGAPSAARRRDGLQEPHEEARGPRLAESSDGGPGLTPGRPLVQADAHLCNLGPRACGYVMLERMILWGLLLATEAALAVAAWGSYRRTPPYPLRPAGQRRRVATALTVLATLPPLAGLFLLAVLFFAGGSPVAQMSLGRMDLWSLWVDAWPLLMLGNAAGALALLASLLVLWRPLSEPLLFWLRLTGLATAIWAWLVLLAHFPDA